MNILIASRPLQAPCIAAIKFIALKKKLQFAAIFVSGLKVRRK